MAADELQASPSHQPTPPPISTAELVARLSRFQGPPHEFLINLLAVQCQVSSAAAGAILRTDAEGRLEVLAVFPPHPVGATAPSWLAHAAEDARKIIAGGATAIVPVRGPDDMYGQKAQRHLVLIPLPTRQQGLQGLAVFPVETADEHILAASREKLELTISLLGLYEMRLTLQRRTADMQRLRAAMEVLATLNDLGRFRGMAMAFCNELASRWECERVSLGFLKGRYVRLAALSHTEKFSRKMKIAQDIEAAMEECLDQDVEVIFPAAPSATFVNRCASGLSKHHGPTSVLSLPLRSAGQAQAVLTLERPSDLPFATEDAEALRLTADLCTARLTDLQERDRWIGARAASQIQKAFGVVIGPKHTWAKVAAIAVLGFAAFLTFAKGNDKAEGTFVLEAVHRQILPAPFDGRLHDVHVEPGVRVQAGKTVLAELDTGDLKLQLLEAQSEQHRYEKQEDAARRDGKTAEAQIAAAQADQIQARIRLLERHIRQATIISPIDGIVIAGDLKRRIGGPVQKGDVLFEVAPLESLRADLYVPEDEIADVLRLMNDPKRPEPLTGELAVAARPSERIALTVKQVHPVAEVVSQKNVFKVTVHLTEQKDWMRPGMEGVGQIHLGTKPYGELWTQRLVNWIRMRMWW